MSYTTPALVRQKTGLTSSEITDDEIIVAISLSDSEIENSTGQRFGNGIVETDYVSFYPPKRADDILPNRIALKHFPVQSITSFLLLDATGNTNTTLATLTSAAITAGTRQTADYYLDPTIGLIELSSYSFDFVPSRAKIAYTYGNATQAPFITELSACLAGVSIWVKYLGGNYDRLNSYTVPEQTYNKGDFYDRGMKIIKELRLKSDELYRQIGKKQSSQFEATSGGFF